LRERRIGNNPRLSLSYKNLAKKPKTELDKLRRHAQSIRKRLKDGCDV